MTTPTRPERAKYTPMKTQHTTGDWRAEKIGADYHDSKEKGMAWRIVAPQVSLPAEYEIAVVYYKPDFKEAAANAALLASAPALYAALLKAREYVGLVRSSDVAGNDPIFAAMDEIDTALALATPPAKGE